MREEFSLSFSYLDIFWEESVIASAALIESFGDSFEYIHNYSFAVLQLKDKVKLITVD